MRRALVLAWFFAVAGGTIGPFDNEAKCNEIREQFLGSTAKTTCWYYGGPPAPDPILRIPTYDEPEKRTR